MLGLVLSYGCCHSTGYVVLLVFGKELLYLEGGLTATTCGYDSLAIAGVGNITGGKDTGYIGGG